MNTVGEHYVTWNIWRIVCFSLNKKLCTLKGAAVTIWYFDLLLALNREYLNELVTYWGMHYHTSISPKEFRKMVESNWNQI